MKRKITAFLFMKIMLGTFMAMSSKHWFLMWMGLETKTISIMPMMASMQKRRKMEASVKYFIIQALAAAIMLNSVLMKMWKKGSWLIKTKIKNFSSMTMCMALLLKLSMAPFHMWFPDMMKGMKLTKGLLMTTWQKIAPTMMSIKVMKKKKKNFLLLCCLLSVLVGAWGGLNQTQTRKLLAFSSITNISWMVTIAMFNPKVSLIMLATYMMMKTTMFMKLMNKKTTKIAKSKKKRLIKPWNASSTVLAMLSLGGLPPLTGFMKKFLGISTLMKKKAFILTVPLIMSSLVSLFFYLRMAFKTKMISFPQKSISLLNIRKSKKVMLKATLNLTSMTGMIILPLMITNL